MAIFSYLNIIPISHIYTFFLVYCYEFCVTELFTQNLSQNFDSKRVCKTFLLFNKIATTDDYFNVGCLLGYET